MTQAHTYFVHLTTVRHLLLIGALSVLMMCALAPSAHAQSVSTTTATSTPEQLERDVRSFLGNSLQNRNSRSIVEKIRQVERRIADMRRQLSAYETLLAELRARASSTAPVATPTASSTQGQSTALFKVVSPNGGSVVKDRNGGVMIRWVNGVGATSISLDLETASGTTSIVQNLPVVSTSSSATSAWGRATRPTVEYMWANAPVGTGYKIVLTGKKGTQTYTDKSDTTFGVRAAGSWRGSVQGDSTMSLGEALKQLETVLKNMSAGL